MANKNKKNVTDVFDGLKYVDKVLNEAAGVKEDKDSLNESFEDRLKKRLTENTEEAETETEDLNEYENAYNYNYNYDETSPNEFLGEEFPEDEDEDEDEFDVDALGLDLDDEAGAIAAADMEDEFSSEDEEENSWQESEEDNEFNFEEDLDLMEALLSEAPEDEVAAPEAVAEVPAVTDALPTDGEIPAPVDVEAGVETPEGDMGLEATPDMGDDMSIPSMGDVPVSEPSGVEDVTATAEVTPIAQPEDIDQLIADLVSPEGEVEETSPVVIGESELKDLGFEDLGDEDVDSKVKMESKDNKTKAIVEGEIKLTKLGDEDITGNVKGAETSKAVKHSGTGKKVDPTGNTFEDLGDEDINSNKVKETGSAKVTAQPKFAELKKESEQKSKALYNLAEQVVDLQDEVSKLKFENFKLKQANSVLTLVEELKQSTREKLVEKFDNCKTVAEVKRLYTEVASMVKEHKRGSINEAVIKNSKSIKHFAESANSVEEDNDQARKNYLMGLEGYDDQYLK